MAKKKKSNKTSSVKQPQQRVQAPENAQVSKTQSTVNVQVPKNAPAPVKVHNSSDAANRQKKTYPWALIADCLLLLVFLFVNGWTTKLDCELVFAIGTFLVFLVTMFYRENRQLLYKKTSTILMVLLAQCVLYFIGLFYASYPKFALQSFFLNTGALFVFATAYVSFLRRDINASKLKTMLAVVVGIASLVSIELATSGYLRGFFTKFAELLDVKLASDYSAFETNTRLTTVLGNANVFAPIAALAMFVALWNCNKADEKPGKTRFQMTLAVILGTTFILCFSLGTILAYFAMLVIYIIVTEKGSRGTQFFRHIYCIVISLIGAGMVFALRNLSILPLVSVIALSVAAAFVYSLIKPVRLPSVNRKLKWGVIGGVAVICVIVIVAALSLRGSYKMPAGATFRRAVDLKPGTYTLQVSFGETNNASSATVDISSMSYAEAALKTKTELVNQKIQPGQAIDFTVPDASAAVFVDVAADTDLVVTKAAISGTGAAVELPLKYKILPEFIVNRLQGLWVNDNAIQRFVFFRDGLRLGARSPIIGLGGGAFEGGIFSVTDYYYQTKHVHNEVIQRFIEGGIVGVLLYAALVVAVFRALVKGRKTEKLRGIYPLLMACMVMIFLHTLIEVDFLMISFRIVSSLLFALVAVYAADSIVIGKKVNTTFKAVFACTVAVTALLAFGRYFANKNIDWSQNLKSLQTAVWMDPFNSSDYKLSYLMNSANSTDTKVMETQEKYLKSMDNQLTGADFLAQYYLTATTNAAKGAEKAELYIHENRVDTKAWNDVFSLYTNILNSAKPGSDAALVIKASAKNLMAYLDELNKTLPLKITPDQSVYSALQDAISK